MPPSLAAPTLHPLAPLSGDEITAAREVVDASGRADGARRGPALRLRRPVRPPQGDGACGRRGGERGGRPPAPPRPPAGSRGGRRGGHRVGHPGRDRPVGGGARRPATPPDRGVDPGAGRAARTPRVERGAGPAGRGRPIAGADRPLARRHLRAGRTRRAGASPAAWPSCASPRRTTATPARSRGCSPSSTWAGARCSRCVDTGVVPLPPKSGSYYPEDNGPLRTDLKPLEITQPEGPSFEVDGNLVRWQKWSLRVGMDPLEGLVLWTVGYEDAGRVRPILYRASVSEMVVPYGHPGPMHAWKSAFDAGEWGLGRMANSLTLGCDCLGEIRYFDDVFADERGKPRTPTERHLHARGGLRHPLEARRHGVGADRGAAVPPPGRELDRHRGQLRVRLLLVLLPRRHHAARGQAHRHHVHHGRGERRRGRPRHA